VPDRPVEPTGPGRYPADMESRVAVLEQIARTTTAALDRIERGMGTQKSELQSELRVFREHIERRLDMQAADLRTLSAEHRADFRWLLGVMLAGFATMLGAFGAMLGVMAHGFHWL
jgi:hypothetical protein